MLYKMKEEYDDGNGSGGSGNPYISGSLCSAYRETIKNEITSMEKSISSKIQLVGAVLGIIVTILTVINVYLSVVM